ncbi:MAG TPA: hypothetical protein VG820_05975, partial [Fimbriimonadaceae bacterium]|nr:hypothetical protein [Fimbriimonadaceae bacterium]
TNEAERRFWLSFYDDALPRALLNNYMDGKGKPLVLTEDQMRAVNGTLDFRRSAAFETKRTELEAAANKGGRTMSGAVSGRFLSPALNNGTLGGFTVHYDGQLSVTPKGAWTYLGTIDYFDRWDFDPRPLSAKSGRSALGELKTRVGAYIEGEPFDVRSVKAKVVATQAGVEWGGKPYKPTPVLDPVTSDRIPQDWKAAPGAALHATGEMASAAARAVKAKFEPPKKLHRDGSLTGPWYPEFGDDRRYKSPEQALTAGPNIGIFVNGPGKGFEDHAREAQELASRMMKPVVGIWDAGGLTHKAAEMRPAVRTLRNILLQHGKAEDKGSGLDIYSPNEFLVSAGRAEARKERDPKASAKAPQTSERAVAAGKLGAADRGVVVPETRAATPDAGTLVARQEQKDHEAESEATPIHPFGIPLAPVAEPADAGPDWPSPELPADVWPDEQETSGHEVELEAPANPQAPAPEPSLPLVAATVDARAFVGVEPRSYDPRLNAVPMSRAVKGFPPRTETKGSIFVQRKATPGRR